jgi:hypothetical protein
MMFSNNFWEGFLLGAFLVFGVFLTSTRLARARAKKKESGG